MTYRKYHKYVVTDRNPDQCGYCRGKPTDPCHYPEYPTPPSEGHRHGITI